MANAENSEAIVVSASEVVIDREHPIGRGGFGTVYRGEHNTHGTVAVKMLITEGVITERDVQTLRKEARRLKQTADHPYIMNLFGVIMEKDNYSLILEYVTFGSSAHFFKDYKVDIELIVRVISDVISAMDYLHGHNPPILHLDLKGDNILIDKKLRAKICDFGLSQWKTVSLTISHRPNVVRQCTITHIAPEILRDVNTPSTTQLDVYAFAIALWEICTGQIPYADRSRDVIQRAVFFDQRPDSTVLRADCPPDIKAMMLRCWHTDAQQRPTFATLKQEIEPLLQSVQRMLPAAMKNIRQQVCEKFAVNDIEYADTEYLDEINVESANARGEIDMADPTSEGSRNDDETAVKSHGNLESTSLVSPDGPCGLTGVGDFRFPATADQPNLAVDPDTGPPTLQTGQPAPASHIPANTRAGTMALPQPHQQLTHRDNQIRKILLDPLALELVNSEHGEKLLPDENVRNLFANPEALMNYINQDTELKLELERSHSPFLANIHSPILRDAQLRGWASGQGKSEKDVSLRGDGSTYRTDQEIASRQLARDKRQETMKHSKYLMNKRGIAQKLATALREAHNVRDALADTPTGTGGAEKFEVIEKRVLEAATDSVLVQIVLSQNQDTLNYLMRNYPDLLMELLAKNNTQYRGPDAEAMRQRGNSHQENRGDKRINTRRPGGIDGNQSASSLIHQPPMTAWHNFKKGTSAPIKEKPHVPKLRFGALIPENKENEKRDKNLKPAEKIIEKPDILMKIKPNEVTAKGDQISSGSAGVLNSLRNVFSSRAMSNDPVSRLSMDELSLEDTGTTPANRLSQDAVPEPNTRPGETTPLPQAEKIDKNKKYSHFKKEKKERPESPTRAAPIGSGADRPLSISHKHEGGAFTQINFAKDMSCTPNIQVGSHQTMIVNQKGDGGDYRHTPAKSMKKEPIKLSTSTNLLNKYQIDGICAEIGRDWRQICRELKLGEGRIEQLHQDFHTEGVYEIVYQAIQKWKQRTGKAATVKAMAEMLHNIGRDDLAKNL